MRDLILASDVMPTPQRKARRGVALVCAFALATTALAGCVPSRETRIGSNDGDACYGQRVALDSTGNYFAEDMVKGAAIGAIGGAVLGGIIGGKRGALIGAAAGLAAGAAGGYWQAKSQQTQDQAQLANSIYADLDRENGQIDRSQEAFNQLVNCRKTQAATIRADLKSGTLSRAEAEVRMADVKTRYAQDLEIAQKINAQIKERSANFQVANENINPGSTATFSSQSSAAPATTTTRKPPKPSQTAQAPAPTSGPQAVRVATASNLSKTDRFSQSVQQAQAAQASGFELG